MFFFVNSMIDVSEEMILLGGTKKTGWPAIVFLGFLLSFIVSFPLPAQEPSTQFYTGNLEDPHGSDICNPCVEDVIHAINTLRNRGETLGFNWGDNHPEVRGAGTKNHWQGVQRMPASQSSPPLIIVTSSHRYSVLQPTGDFVEIAEPSRFAVVEMASRDNGDGRLRSNRLEYGRLTRDVRPDQRDRIVESQIINRDFDHPGGIQAIGKYLLVGTDGAIDHFRETAAFSLWDMANARAPRAIWDSPVWELPGANANSAGIARLDDGRYLMLRALGDAKNLEFYLLDSSLESNPAESPQTELWDSWHYSELQSELYNPDGTISDSWARVDELFGPVGYQNTNVVVECGTGTLYLIASHGRSPQGFGDEDWVHAFRIDLPRAKPATEQSEDGVIITKVARRRLYPDGNAQVRQGDLQAAGGAYVSPDNKLYFYATEHGRTGTGGFVHMIEFGPREPLEQVDYIEQAWVELYDSTNTDGRSIILDYVDRALRDYSDFSRIERFDGICSSLIYAIPAGYKLRLFSEPNAQGAYFDLEGTGESMEIADLSTVELSNGATAENQFQSAQWLSTAVAEVRESFGQAAPKTFELYQNYPNPFNPETTIQYQLQETAVVRLALYDIRGQQIRLLMEGSQPAGFYSMRWNGKDELGNSVASGTYLYRLEIGEEVAVKKLTLVR